MRVGLVFGMGTGLDVEIVELEPFRVAYLTYQPDGSPAEMFGEVKACFDRVTGWAVEHEVDLKNHRVVGIPVTERGKLLSYDCCVEVSDGVDGDGVLFRVVPGGRYCVLVMEKDSEVIGESIGRFYGEYVPENGVQVDLGRPVLELYTRDLMEYCVPIT